MIRERVDGAWGSLPRAKFPAGAMRTDAALQLETIVASAFQVDAGAIRATGRGTAAVAFARQVGMYLACTRLGAPYSVAGAIFGRDRTTAAYACRLVEERREDPRIDSTIDCIERAIDLCPQLSSVPEVRLGTRD